MNLGSWIWRLLTWDGALPAGVFLAPAAIELLFPNRRGAIEVTAIVLPISAFFVRAVVGGRHIASNNCSSAFRQVQYAALGLGIFMLVFVDAVLILSHVMPKPPAIAAPEDYVVLGTIGLIYLTIMGFAMYPGPPKELPEVLTL